MFLILEAARGHVSLLRPLPAAACAAATATATAAAAAVELKKGLAKGWVVLTQSPGGGLKKVLAALGALQVPQLQRTELQSMLRTQLC